MGITFSTINSVPEFCCDGRHQTLSLFKHSIPLPPELILAFDDPIISGVWSSDVFISDDEGSATQKGLIDLPVSAT
jgi:hypothetical protein